MTQPILLKRSAVAARVPTTAQLALGELGINTYDGKLYLAKNNGTASIVEIGSATLSGDVTGTISGQAGTLTLANSGVTAGAYRSVTVDAKGRVTAGSNPGAATPYMGSTAPQSGSTIILAGSSLPTITNGTQLWSQVVIPLSSSSKFEVIQNFWVDSNVSNRFITFALFRDTTCVSVYCVNVPTAGRLTPAFILAIDAPATASSVTYSLRVGIDQTATWYLNQKNGGGITFGGTSASNSAWLIEELI